MWKWFHRGAIHAERQRVLALLAEWQRYAERHGGQVNAAELAMLAKEIESGKTVKEIAALSRSELARLYGWK